MQFIITSGTWFEDGDRYEERSRFTVTVRGANPTVGAILKEVKRQPQPSFMERHKPHFYLIRPETRERLDDKKRAADYKLSDGATLWLMTAVR